MKPTILLSGLAALLIPTTTSAVSTTLVKNYLPSAIYLTIYNNGTTTGPFSLASDEAYFSEIIGQGNTATVSDNADIYSPSTAKMVFGTSTYEGIIYWSINNVSGDPLAGKTWDVTSDGTVENVCGNTTGYSTAVRACQDNSVTLTLSLG